MRRAFLVGDGYEHRKDWIIRRLRFLSQVFSCEIAAFAVMSNHLHLVVRMVPEEVRTKTDQEVIERWLRVAGLPRASGD